MALQSASSILLTGAVFNALLTQLLAFWTVVQFHA